MDLRIVDLDGSLRKQPRLLRQVSPAIHDLGDWGPRVPLGCSFRRFEQFESALAAVLGSAHDPWPMCTFLGSGDFHHVSLALLRRIEQPFNLLILDNHPDWMRGIPVMHCGSWVHHATKLANLRTVYHVGGDVDFDNNFRRLAPWASLHSGKIQVIAARRPFRRGPWGGLGYPALRAQPHFAATTARIEQLVKPFRDELARWPLYISLDKDVLGAGDAVVNWDSGHLTIPEVEDVLRAFVGAARQQLAGMDVVGDWSAVRVRGWFRRFLHLTEHPWLNVKPLQAAQRNESLNLRLLKLMTRLMSDEPMEAEEFAVAGV